MSRARLAGILLACTLAMPARPAEPGACPLGAETAVGRKARVTLAAGGVSSGRIVRVDGETLVLRSDGREITLDAQAIRRIEIRSRGKSVRNILLSAGAGALAGVLFGAAYDEADSDSLAILFAWIGAGGGAGIGAALPARTIVCD